MQPWGTVNQARAKQGWSKLNPKNAAATTTTTTKTKIYIYIQYNTIYLNNCVPFKHRHFVSSQDSLERWSRMGPLEATATGSSLQFLPVRHQQSLKFARSFSKQNEMEMMKWDEMRWNEMKWDEISQDICISILLPWKPGHPTCWAHLLENRRARHKEKPGQRCRQIVTPIGYNWANQ